MSKLHDGRFARIERLLGHERLERLTKASVCIIGLGAVGSYATEALARAGVGHLRVVDFDEVRLSNINRQLFAVGSTLGHKKCEIARRRIHDINPNCQVEAVDTFVHYDTLDEVLAGEFDMYIDAIDALTPKVNLIEALYTRGLPFISSMGAALRTDPTMVRIGHLDRVHNCPLAAQIRKRLRRRNVGLDFTCVYSIEPVAQLPPEAIDREALENEDIVERGRKRGVLGSLPTLTGIFGLTIANTAIKQITLK